MIKAIFFDASDVLYGRPVSTSRFAAGLLAQGGYGPDLDPAAEEGVRAAHERAMIGEIDAEAYWHVFLTAHGVVGAAERAEIAALILEQANIIRPAADARPTLAALKQRGFTLGIVTDTIYPLAWKLRWLADVADLLDHVTSSAAVGARKPAPAIYLAALSRAGLAPSDAVFVGHDAREIAGARRVGMTTVALGDEPGVTADYRIGALSELLTIPLLRTAARDTNENPGTAAKPADV